MKLSKLLTVVALAGFASVASADLEPWTDYDISESVMNVTTVKVDSNMIDKYLEGLSKTWVPANETAKGLGQFEEYGIFVSELPNGGEFNVVLVVTMANAADMQPNKEDYDAFMKAWGEANEDTVRERVKDYPSMRNITGEYMVRKIDIK